jgi:hypothetical protein
VTARGLALATTAAVAVAGCGATVAAPPLTPHIRAELARKRAEQAPRRAVVAAAGRRAVLTGLERAITADARARVRRGLLPRRDPVLRTHCGARHGSADVFSCIAITAQTRKSRVTPVGVLLGYPFLARVDFATGRLAWCKLNPIPGEGFTPPPDEIVPVSRACGGEGTSAR